MILLELEKLCMGCMLERDSKDIVCPDCGYEEGAAPDSPLFLPPRTILEDKYLIGRVLGQGGFGITYLAWDINLNVKLAIKEFFPQDLASRAAGHSQVSAYSGNKGSQYEYGLDKFLQEARTLAQFEGHPNIVSVRDFFKANGTAYFVMSYVEGMTLKQHLANSGGKLTFDKAKNIILPVTDALKEVHAVNILHRDISPDNIFINNKGQIILIDFGAARQAIGEKGRSLSIILKPGYAPEEQYRSKGVQGPWTDIYAVAATLYHLITGWPPPEALERLSEDPLVPPSQMGADLDETAERALMKALAVKADNRFQSIEEFQDAMLGKKAVADLVDPVSIKMKPSERTDIDYAPPPSEPVAQPAKKKTPITFVLLAAAVLLAGVSLYGLWAGGILGGAGEPDVNLPVATDDPPPVDEVSVVNLKGNTSGNIVNSGLAAVQGEWIFFRSNEGGSLYKAKLNSNNARILSTDAAWFINVSGEHVYYSNRDDNNRLYRIRSDGSNRMALTDNGAWFATLVNETIYYLDEGDQFRIYKINADGSGRIRVSDDEAWFLNVAGDWIYYINRSDDDKIYRVRTDAGEKEQLTEHSACCLNVDENWIYHVNEDDESKLYRYNINNGEMVALTDHPAWFVNVYENGIYYVNENDNFTIYKMNLDGSGRIKLTNEPSRYVVVTDDWIFYLDQAAEDTIYKVRQDGTGRSLAESGL